MKFELKHRISGKVLFSTTATTIRQAVELAVKASADLSGVDLYGANIYRANLYGKPVTKVPIQIQGLKYPVIVTDVHIAIGCEVHTVAEWKAFTNEQIEEMDVGAP